MSEDPRVRAAVGVFIRDEVLELRNAPDLVKRILAAADAVDPLRQGPISGGVLELCERLAEVEAERDRYWQALVRIKNEIVVHPEDAGPYLRAVAAAALAPEHQERTSGGIS